MLGPEATTMEAPLTVKSAITPRLNWTYSAHHDREQVRQEVVFVHEHQVAHDAACIAHHGVGNTVQVLDEHGEGRSLVFLFVVC